MRPDNIKHFGDEQLFLLSQIFVWSTSLWYSGSQFEPRTSDGEIKVPAKR